MSFGLLEAVHLTFIGMGVVFAGLIVLYLVMLLVGHSLGREKTAGGVGPGAAGPEATGPGAVGPGTPGPAAEEPAAEGEVAPDIVAVISGAVYTTLGAGVRLRSIRVSRSATGTRPSLWAIAGRQELMMPETAFRRRAGDRLIPTRGEDARG